MAIRMAMMRTTTMSSMRVKPSSSPRRRRSMSFCSMTVGSPCDDNEWMSPWSPPLGPPPIATEEVLQVARLAFPVVVDEGSAPWRCAPASRQVCLCQEHQLDRSIDPCANELEPRLPDADEGWPEPPLVN